MSEVTTVELTVSRVITEEGLMVVRIKIPEQYNAVEILGLLEATKMHIFKEMRHDS